MRYVCPKCRQLGLPTDCSERLTHAQKANTPMSPHEDYDLDVTFTFTVPVTSTLPLGPHEMATHMRETWMNDDTEFARVLDEAVDTEYDLQVVPTRGL